METLIRCDACGFDALPAGWRPDTSAIPTAHPGEIPAGTRIRREGTGMGERIWHIPASGKFGFFLFFGLFWTGITAILSSAFQHHSHHRRTGVRWHRLDDDIKHMVRPCKGVLAVRI